ncbi:MAG: T9SS type A sorting domain-containing protein [Bacteroidales bacterium]|nr:T9SS type A sorting domain-containing protein [Bacteroidales bacterium]
MKKIKLLIIGLSIFTIFINANINGQPYEPVLKSDSTSWDIGHQELYGIQMHDLYTVDSFSGEYQLMKEVLFEDTLNGGWLHEITGTGELWYKSPDGQEERLLMRMDLEIGDEFELQPGMTSTVEDIYYTNERKHIQFEINSNRWNEKLTFIEGVFPNVFSFSSSGDFDWYYCTCKYNDGNLVYVNNNPAFDGCEPDPTGLTQVKYKDSDFCRVSDGNILIIDPGAIIGNISVLSIVDLHGRVLVHKNLRMLADYTLHLNHLSNGLYIVKLTQNNQTLSKKILINH